jgi:4-hydroxybenzoate polyprenyltransferase
LVNGSVIEIARKCWAPEMEREGVETYSKLWGAERAGIVVMALALAGLALSAFINVRSDAGLVVLAGLMLVTMFAAWTAIDYAGTPTAKKVKQVEAGTAVLVLGNYLLLGVIPLLMSLVPS